MQFDRATEFKDATVHEAVEFALQSVLKAQFPNGAWPQGYQEFPEPSKYPVKSASYPESWPRKYPGGDYWVFYTFNDNALVDTMETLFLAADIYGQKQYLQAAMKAAEFILLAQMPEPQPAWAQQYDFDMHPVWAREFEPPAVSGGESQNIVRMLLRLYEETEDRRFLNSADKAISYLKNSQLPDRRLARFYELQTNKPLYLTKIYELTYDDNDLPTHYGFQLSSRAADLRKQFDEVAAMTPKQLKQRREKHHRLGPKQSGRPSDAQVKEVIEALDERALGSSRDVFPITDQTIRPTALSPPRRSFEIWIS